MEDEGTVGTVEEVVVVGVDEPETEEEADVEEEEGVGMSIMIEEPPELSLGCRLWNFQMLSLNSTPSPPLPRPSKSNHAG